MASKMKIENVKVAKVTYSTYVDGKPTEKSIFVECNNEKELKTALNKKGIAIGMCNIVWGGIIHKCKRVDFLAICEKGEFIPQTPAETETETETQE